jgi:hypothetical protein
LSRIAYVSGQYLPHRQAAVHIEDRGYQFGDGVYSMRRRTSPGCTARSPSCASPHRWAMPRCGWSSAS